MVYNANGNLVNLMNRRQKIGFVSVASLVMAIAAFAGIKQLQNSYAATVHYVSTTGSDTNPGTQAAPWRTMKKSLSSLAAGDTLMVGGGTYVEDLSLTMNGSSGAPITVKNVAGQRPIIEGLLAVTLNYVTMDGINVHWRDGKSVDVHMLKLNGGTGWRWTNSEIWGAKSWANILITQSPNAWSLDHNRIHNNDGTSHTAVQDHNVYVNTTNSSNTGKIEHNLFYASPRGESIKLDGTGSGSGGGMNISVKYNTMVGASRGMLMGGQSHGNDIAYNIIIPSAGDGIGFYLYNCSGTGNKLHDNIFYGYKTAIQVAGSASAMSDTNNAKGTINPQLDSSYRDRKSVV